MMGLLRSSPKTPDYKRPPLRESNGFYSPTFSSGRRVKYETKRASYPKRILSIFLYTILASVVLLSLASAILYINCSNAVGFEIIPKSHQLCHDLYQLIQTGRFSLTWDYKASFGEIGHIIQRALASTVDWFKDFSLETLKDDLIAALVACRDSIVGFPLWVYENSGQVACLIASLFWELLAVIRVYVAWAFYGALHLVSGAFEWFKVSAIEVFNSIPVYWEKVMDKLKM